MYHKVVIVGNLGRDPETRYTNQGTPVTNMVVAANRTYTSSGGDQVKETVWFRVSAWGRLAEVCERYLKKGMRVLVEGRLIPDPDTGGPRVFTRKDGTFGAAYEVRAEVVRFLTSRAESEALVSDGDAEATAAPADDLPGMDEEIPF